MTRSHPVPAVVALLTAASFALPAPAVAQSPMELLRTIRQGGGWISLPVTEGVLDVATDTVPTLGIALEGCLTVWPGHSGTWTLEADDPLNDQRLEAVARPGEGVPFSYRTGPRSVLDVRVRWSEPRDTVLHLWVGVDVPAIERDACEPRYRRGAEGGVSEDAVPER